MKLHARTRKGQSAIEYLTTYGWALLAIIVVGAVLVQMGVFNQCQTVTPQFSGNTVAVDTFAFTDTNSIDVVVQAIDRDVTLQEIELVVNGNEYNATSLGQSISAGQTATVTVDTSSNAAGDGPAFSSGECASAQVNLVYDISGTSITGAQAAGSGALRAPVP